MTSDPVCRSCRPKRRKSRPQPLADQIVFSPEYRELVEQILADKTRRERDQRRQEMLASYRAK
jgi:hypothetical protein